MNVNLLRYIPIIGLLLLLGGCAVVSEFEQTKLNPRIDKVVDGVYKRVCDLRYSTEQRFLARNQMTGETLDLFCKRP